MMIKLAQIDNLLKYFKKYCGYIRFEWQGNCQLICKQQDINTKIFQTVKSPTIFQNKCTLINTPQFDMDSEVKQRNEMINELSQTFKKYQNQTSLFLQWQIQKEINLQKKILTIFIIIEKNQMRLLLYKLLEDDFQEISKLYNYFINILKIRNVYTLSNSQLQNQQQIVEYFNKTFQEQEDGLKIRIDMTGTIFEINDVREFEEDYKKAKVEQLKQSIEQDDQQIKLNQQNIAEIEKSKQQKLTQIREIELFYQKQRVEKILPQAEIHSQHFGEKIYLYQKISSTTNLNQAQLEINYSQTIKQEIEYLLREQKSINSQIQDCYHKLKNIPKTQNNQTIQKLQLSSQLNELLQKQEDSSSKIKECNNQLEQLHQDTKKDNQKYHSVSNVYNGNYINHIYQTSKKIYDNYRY